MSGEWVEQNVDVVDVEITSFLCGLRRKGYSFEKRIDESGIVGSIISYQGTELGEIEIAPNKLRGHGVRCTTRSVTRDPRLVKIFQNLLERMESHLDTQLVWVPQAAAELHAELQRETTASTEPQADSEAVAEQLTPTEDEDSSLIKILFLAANPVDTDRLRLGAEMRAIDLALQQALFRDRFDLRQHWAVQATDLQHYLLRHQPDIVHFSGHGSVSSEIILEDVSGNSRPVSVRALSTLFSVLKDNIKCVVLNACYSEQQAQAIAQSIDCVIGMSKAIGDDAAIGFATAFYRALGFGRDVKTAFELGCVQIDLEGLDEQDTPKLLALKIPPENIFFIKQTQ